MKTSEDFADADKNISKQIMQEFKGENVTSDCPVCKGEGITTSLSGGQNHPCLECDGSGFVEYEY